MTYQLPSARVLQLDAAAGRSAAPPRPAPARRRSGSRPCPPATAPSTSAIHGVAPGEGPLVARRAPRPDREDVLARLGHLAPRTAAPAPRSRGRPAAPGRPRPPASPAGSTGSGRVSVGPQAWLISADVAVVGAAAAAEHPQPRQRAPSARGSPARAPPGRRRRAPAPRRARRGSSSRRSPGCRRSALSQAPPVERGRGSASDARSSPCSRPDSRRSPRRRPRSPRRAPCRMRRQPSVSTVKEITAGMPAALRRAGDADALLDVGHGDRGDHVGAGRLEHPHLPGVVGLGLGRRS